MSEETKHTPGPRGHSAKLGSLSLIKKLRNQPTEFDLAELIAERDRLKAINAQLLEALESLFKECAMIHKYGGDACNQKEADQAVADARAAIAKAKGEDS